MRRDIDWGDRLLRLTVLLWPAVIASLLFVSYRGIVASDAWSISVVDGWCDDSESIGAHCFGDFGYARSMGGRDHPYEEGNGVATNTPLTIAAFWLLSLLPYRLGLGIYFASLIACVVVPLLIATRGRDELSRVTAVVFLGLATTGFIAAIDRGNAVPLMIPAAFAMIVSNSRKTLIVAAGAALSIKFWGILLFPILLGRRKYREAAAGIVVAAVANLGAAWLFERNLGTAISRTAEAVLDRDYGNSISGFAVSFIAMVRRTACLLGDFALCPTAPEGESFPGPAIMGGVAIVWVLVATWCARSAQMPLAIRFSPALAATFLLVPEAAIYNLSMITVVACLVLLQPPNSLVRGEQWVLIVAVALSTIPMALGLSPTPWLTLQRAGYWIPVLTWTPVLIACCWAVFASKRERSVVPR